MPLYFMERFKILSNIANHISLQTYWTQPVMSYGRRYRLIWFSDLIADYANYKYTPYLLFREAIIKKKFCFYGHFPYPP